MNHLAGVVVVVVVVGFDGRNHLVGFDGGNHWSVAKVYSRCF